MIVSALHIYPVKGLAGIPLSQTVLEPWGLQHDRRWLVIDPAGRFLTQRTLPRMTLIRTEVTARGFALTQPGHGSIHVDIPVADAPLVQVTVWHSTLPAALAEPAAHAWVSAALGQPCRLAYMHDTTARPVEASHGRPGETVSFADGYPVLLTSLASLADLNARLPRPVALDRFRGNITVGGAHPWAEDTWRVIRIGGAVFRVAKPCSRCIVTTIDQDTGKRPHRTEPLRTLGTFRRDKHGIMFGQNLVPAATGRIALGDAIEVLEQGTPNVLPLAG